MKRSRFICIFLILTILLFTGCQDSKEEYLTSEQAAKKQGEKLMEGIKKRDIETVKEIFCDSVKDRDTTDDEITHLINFMDGEIISYGEPDINGATGKKRESEMVNKCYSVKIENIKTSAGKTYKIVYGYYDVNKSHPEYVGVASLSIYDEDAYLEGIGYTNVGQYDIEKDYGAEE